MPDTTQLLTPAAVAEELGVAVQTLAHWRCTKRYDLPYIRVGSKIRYRRADIEAFIAARRESTGA